MGMVVGGWATSPRPGAGGCRAFGAAGEAAPRPYRPGRPIPGRAQGHHRDALPPFVGVRRCLTHPARRAGRPPLGPVGHLSCPSPPADMCHGIPRAIRRGRARQRLAPTGTGDARRVPQWSLHRRRVGGACLRPVGVRRCLTRRPGGPAHAPGTRRGLCPTMVARRARQRLAPTQAWNPVDLLPGALAGVGSGRRDPVTRRVRAGGNARSVSDRRERLELPL